ncbi:RscC [Beggiatoa sp. PS]|nr:RscC [Beggiatoa sp. PS]
MNQKNEISSTDSAIEIREIASLVYQSQFEPALGLIIKLLEKAELRGGIQQSQNTGIEAENDSLKEYTQLAGALTTLLAHPTLQLSPPGFERLVLHKTHFLGIFQLSGYRETDYLLSLIGSKGGNTGNKTHFVFKGEQQVTKFLVLYSLYSETEIDFTIFLKNVPTQAMPTYLGLCAEKCILLPLAAARRERLLELGTLLENIPLMDNYLVRLSHVWMNCSYANSKNKHDIKAHLNVVLQKWMTNKGIKIPPLPVQRSKTERPVMLIPSERFTSNHAMFRCYAPSIQQLRDKFHLVLMTDPKQIDDNSKTYFDQIIEVDFKASEAKKLVGKVIKLKPDIIYYPSLGMEVWTLLLANLRLAPIQLMTLGHPATSRSPVIDYVLMREAILF